MSKFLLNSCLSLSFNNKTNINCDNFAYSYNCLNESFSLFLSNFSFQIIYNCLFCCFSFWIFTHQKLSSLHINNREIIGNDFHNNIYSTKSLSQIYSNTKLSDNFVVNSRVQSRIEKKYEHILKPKIILYDEPTTGMDPLISELIDSLILEMQKKIPGLSSVVISHDIQSVLRLADRIFFLHEGKMYATGTPTEFRASTDPIIQQFITGSLKGPLGQPIA
jgi:hypothetical protein